MTQTETSGMAAGIGTNPPVRQLTSCDDVACELLVDPIPRPTPDPISVILEPKVAKVTFVDHDKPNSRLLLEYTQTILRDRGVEVHDEIIDKGNASIRMSDAVLQSFVGEEGLVLCGVSD